MIVDELAREMHVHINRLDRELFELRRQVEAMEKDVQYALSLGFPLGEGASEIEGVPT